MQILLKLFCLCPIVFRSEQTAESPSQTLGLMQKLSKSTRLLPYSSSIAKRDDEEQKEKLGILFNTRRTYLQNGLLVYL